MPTVTAHAVLVYDVTACTRVCRVVTACAVRIKRWVRDCSDSDFKRAPCLCKCSQFAHETTYVCESHSTRRLRVRYFAAKLCSCRTRVLRLANYACSACAAAAATVEPCKVFLDESTALPLPRPHTTGHAWNVRTRLTHAAEIHSSRRRAPALFAARICAFAVPPPPPPDSRSLTRQWYFLYPCISRRTTPL